MAYCIDNTKISHERLGDEVIIINLVRGSYYSGSGTAADVWTLISSGVTVDQAVTALASVYGEDEAIVHRDVQSCVESLEALEILTPGKNSKALVPILPAVARTEWVPPVFDEYTDMWDLLQADPIHDVTDAGWPFVIPESKVE
jgi:hypothetical protein